MCKSSPLTTCSGQTSMSVVTATSISGEKWLCLTVTTRQVMSLVRRAPNRLWFNGSLLIPSTITIWRGIWKRKGAGISGQAQHSRVSPLGKDRCTIHSLPARTWLAANTACANHGQRHLIQPGAREALGSNHHSGQSDTRAVYIFNTPTELALKSKRSFNLGAVCAVANTLEDCPGLKRLLVLQASSALLGGAISDFYSLLVKRVREHNSKTGSSWSAKALANWGCYKVTGVLIFNIVTYALALQAICCWLIKSFADGHLQNFHVKFWHRTGEISEFHLVILPFHALSHCCQQNWKTRHINNQHSAIRL